MTDSGPTEEYRTLAADDGALVKTMGDEELLTHFLKTRLLIERDDRIYIEEVYTNVVRLRYALAVSSHERAEILRRMRGNGERQADS